MPESATREQGPSSAWGGALDATRRSAVLFVARDVAVRATDRERIAVSMPLARRQTRYPESVQWNPCGLAGGEAGIAVMCSYFDQCFPGEGWDAIGHGFLAGGMTALEAGGSTYAGLFAGLSGFAFALESLSRSGDRYQRALTAVDELLALKASGLAARLGAAEPGLPVSAFDLVSGASGVAAYLLRRDSLGVLPDVLTALVRLAAPSRGTPRWATPPELLLSESTRRLYPSGQLNCGLAHGIPGPLAVLSLAMRGGHEVPGQPEAVRALAEWLLSHRVDDAWGGGWPDAVPLTPAGRPAPGGAPVATRGAWCYGTAGVARSLWLAGEALDDDGLRSAAVEGLSSVLRRPIELRYLNSSTYCHGVAGLLQIAVRFTRDTAADHLADALTALVDQLLAAYEPHRPFGYASWEAADVAVDRAGLLDGAAGVAMALLAAVSRTDPVWDRMFLLS
ncbi:lanthionine synthetase C family protein [Streptomyces sp. NBC_00063]|uniref:lanthionine synthetase C family protein n=1 Tax=Streptomyces sp. NBC_00063 TaxID=2975638 RepID=UPI00225B180C|nr:lanthionine synthetase C family protein [Streptomyces sp. NBC_00063]MCX5441275.1 lanthionine synthetase C family protein [Streptomyces sp. NBC_00063]